MSKQIIKKVFFSAISISCYGMETPQLMRKKTNLEDFNTGVFRLQPSTNPVTSQRFPTYQEFRLLQEEVAALKQENRAVKCSFETWRDCTQKLEASQRLRPLPLNYKEPLDELAVKLDACHIWQSMQDQDFIALQNKVKNMRRDLDSLHTILANQPRLFLYKDLQKVVKALNKLATKNKPEIDELKSSLKKIQEQLQSDPHAADIAELRKLLQEINLNSVSTDDWGILQERCENVEEASETCLMVALGSILTLLCQRSRTYTKILYAGITRCLYPEIPQFENLPYDDVEDGRID